jgi:hypothetical protein
MMARVALPSTPRNTGCRGLSELHGRDKLNKSQISDNRVDHAQRAGLGAASVFNDLDFWHRSRGDRAALSSGPASGSWRLAGCHGVNARRNHPDEHVEPILFGPRSSSRAYLRRGGKGA